MYIRYYFHLLLDMQVDFNVTTSALSIYLYNTSRTAEKGIERYNYVKEKIYFCF